MRPPATLGRPALLLLCFWAAPLLPARAQVPPGPDGLSSALPERPATGDEFGGEPVSRETMRPLRPGEREPAFLATDGETAAGAVALTPGIAGALAPSGDPNLDGIPDLDAAGSDAPGAEEARRRLWRLVPLVAVGMTYDDNLFLRNTDRRGDFIFNLDSGLAFELGDFRDRQDNYLVLSYLGSALFYSRHGELDAYNPAFNLFAQYRRDPFVWQADSAFVYQRGVQRLVGGFTVQTIVRNTLRALYEYSDKTTFDLSLNQLANIYEDNISSYYYDIKAGFSHRLTSKLSAGLEGVAGFVEADESPTMYYQTANLRLAYEATDKVALRATGGLEFNEYASGGEPLRLLPVFSLGLEYLPLSATTVSLVAYRNIQNSPSIVRQDYIATGFELGVTQRLGRRFLAGVAFGYENDTYVSNVAAVKATRVDNYVFARPSLSYSFLKYLTATVSYEYRANDSTLERDSWYDNRINFEISAEF
jgi:hypothetical protein